MKDRILFIDTETGGLNPDKHSLLSLAMVVWEDMEIIDSMETLINDGQLITTEEALAVNKIDIEKHKETAISSTKAIEEIIGFISKHFPEQTKITLAGHNVHFDCDFLKVFLSKNGKSFNTFFSHRIIDTSSILYYLYLSGQLKQKAISSDQAFEYFALGDAMATAVLFNKLMELLKKH